MTLNWQQFQVVSAIVRTGSIKGAARDLCLSEATVRKKLEHVEQVAKARLFERTASGLVATEDGEMIASAVNRMAERAREIEHTLRSRSNDHLGEVRVAVTEGLGTFWVMPHLTKLQIGVRNISLNFDCSMVPPDLKRGDADLAVHFDPLPSNPDFSRKIADVEIRLYASKPYIEEFGDPATVADLVGHRFVRQVGPQIDEGAAPQPLRELVDEATVITTNTSSAHFYAVANGAGIGALPTYAREVTDRITQISFPLSVRREVYLSVRPEREKVKRVRVVMDWLEKTFDPSVHPYFGDGRGLAERAAGYRSTGFFDDYFAS